MRQLEESIQYLLEDIAMGVDENDWTLNLGTGGDDILDILDPIPDNLDPTLNSNHDDLNPEYPCKAVNDLLSEDLMTMPLRDRTLLSEELHGVRSLAIEENDDDLTKEKVSNAMFELDQILEHRIPVREKTAFLKAQSLEQTIGTYVNDAEFRMKFLRCKLFNVKEAAQLLINYLELVQEIYGDICLSRPIRLKDLQITKDERVAFRNGYIQLLPFGDRAGRRILMITTDALCYSTHIRVRLCIRMYAVL